MASHGLPYPPPNSAGAKKNDTDNNDEVGRVPAPTKHQLAKFYTLLDDCKAPPHCGVGCNESKRRVDI